MKIDIEYIEGQIKATATNEQGNTASWSEDLGISIAFVHNKDCTDAHFEHENLINGVVHAAQTASRCAISLLEDAFKVDAEDPLTVYKSGESSIELHGAAFERRKV